MKKWRLSKPSLLIGQNLKIVRFQGNLVFRVIGDCDLNYTCDTMKIWRLSKPSLLIGRNLKIVRFQRNLVFGGFKGLVM